MILGWKWIDVCSSNDHEQRLGTTCRWSTEKPMEMADCLDRISFFFLDCLFVSLSLFPSSSWFLSFHTSWLYVFKIFIFFSDQFSCMSDMCTVKENVDIENDEEPLDPRIQVNFDTLDKFICIKIRFRSNWNAQITQPSKSIISKLN